VATVSKGLYGNVAANAARQVDPQNERRHNKNVPKGFSLMPVHAALQATTRVALVAYLHDLGKLAERAGAFKSDPRLDANLQLYCPFHQDGGWFSHRHAANTSLAMDTLEPHLPRLLGLDPYPFTGRRRAGDADGADGVDATDSMLNAAAGGRLATRPEQELRDRGHRYAGLDRAGARPCTAQAQDALARRPRETAYDAPAQLLIEAR